MNTYNYSSFELPPDTAIKLCVDSIGPAVAAIVVFIILVYTLISYFYNRNGSIMLSIITLQFSFFLLLSGYALYSTSTTAAKVDFWTRISYMGLSISPIFGISFIEGVINKSFKKIKHVTVLNCIICIALIWFEDKWIITRQVKITTHPTMIKGMGFNLLVLYIVGYLFTCYIIFMRYYIKHPECRSIYWPLAVGFTGWSVSGLFGALHATNIIRLNDLTWVGPIITMLAIALYQGKLLSKRSKELEKAIKEKDALYEKIIRDDLTGVLNRNYLMHTLVQNINNPSFDSVEHCLLFIDLDNFKKINEIYGHQGGDALLRLVGKILRETCRKSDIPSRFGGDEFLLYLYDCNEEQAVGIARRIQERYEEEFYKIIDKSTDIGAGLCIGISSSRYWNKTISDIIDQPDFAMFEAKKAGKNRIGIFAGQKNIPDARIPAVNLV